MDARVVGIPEVDGTEQVAVVIDVMRAFTTAAWAFHRGADKIVLAADQGEALRIKASHPGWLALKDGAPASGFDLVNSPGRIREADLAGRTVVQKTTAGTVGALAVVEAELALCASFVVAGAAGDRPDAGPFLHRARTSPPRTTCAAATPRCSPRRCGTLPGSRPVRLRHESGAGGRDGGAADATGHGIGRAPRTVDHHS